MTLRYRNMGTGQGREIWSVLLVLLAAAVVPTACILWFMNAAMQNERLAVRQRLSDVYRQKVQTDQNEIAAWWSFRTHLDTDHQPSAEIFEKLVRSGMFSSVIVLDKAGRSAYPQPAATEPASQPSDSPSWDEARSLEYDRQDYARAAGVYGQVAKAAKDARSRAAALQAQARCLVRAGTKEQALAILAGPLADPSLKDTVDSLGRLIQPNAQLLALQLMGSEDGRFPPLSHRLAERLNQYRESSLPSAQRRFLMESLEELGVKDVTLPTLAAERLAGEYLQGAQPPAEELLVTPTALPRVWQMGSADHRLILLFNEDKLLGGLKAACKLDEPFVGITTRLELPGQRERGKEPFLALPASKNFPGWQLAVYLDEDPFAASAQKSESLYLAAGISAIAVITLLAGAMALYFGRQIKLTRLKNDLIATVSHELKTPLASMRVLVDTLREGRCPDAKQAGEYFDLMAKENERLSRLIDNFLTFSRMERNKRAFEFTTVEVNEVVQAATQAVRDRFSSPGSQLGVEVPAGLPCIHADRDAMVTVILNLLENAWKYTGERKAVTLRAYAADGGVFIEVSDNGIGMTRRAVRRIFDKFYQVDQTLARKAGGCGLGLAIVKFILDAHGGTIEVKSQPGKGSRFTVRLPAANAPTAGQ